MSLVNPFSFILNQFNISWHDGARIFSMHVKYPGWNSLFSCLWLFVWLFSLFPKSASFLICACNQSCCSTCPTFPHWQMKFWCEGLWPSTFPGYWLHCSTVLPSAPKNGFAPTCTASIANRKENKLCIHTVPIRRREKLFTGLAEQCQGGGIFLIV